MPAREIISMKHIILNGAVGVRAGAGNESDLHGLSFGFA
jgi:hypothetical protein